MAFNASLYAQLRPDLLTNWSHAGDSAWQNDPNVPGIRSYGTIENYLQADYESNAAGNDAQLASLFGQIRPDLLNNWSHVNDPAYANDPNLPAIAAFGSLDNYLASQYAGYDGHNLSPYSPLSPYVPPESSSSNSSSNSDSGVEANPSGSPFSNGGVVIDGVPTDFDSPTFGGVLIPFAGGDGSNGGSSNGTYGSTGENTYVPGGSDNIDYYAPPPSTTTPTGGIAVNTDPNVVGSTTGDSNTGLPNNIPISIDGLDLGNSGGGFPSGGGGIFSGGGNGGFVLPLPVDPLTAIGATILLNNGNIFGGGGSGGGSLGNLGSQIGNIVTNPIGSVSSSLENLNSGLVGLIGTGKPTSNPPSSNPITPGGGSPSNGAPNQSNGGTTTILPIDTGGNAGPAGPLSPDNGHDSSGPVFSEPTDLPPASPIIAPVSPPNQPATPAPVIPSTAVNQPNPSTPDQATTPASVVPISPPSTTSSPPSNNSTTPTDHPTTPSTVVPIPTTPTTPSTPASPTSPTTVTTPTVPAPTSMPDTSVASPLDRNYYREGNQTTLDLQQLLSGMAALYGNASGQYGQTDFTNWQKIMNQYGSQNAALTGQANQQTTDSNTALRTGNVNDVGALGGQALSYLQNLNPNQYAALNQAQAGSGALGTQNQYQQQLGQQYAAGPQYSQVNAQTGYMPVQTQFSGPQVNANTSFNNVNAQTGDAGLNFANGQLGQIAPSSIQQLLEKQAMDNLSLGGSLSDQERNIAQQTAREAWGARGLINSQGAVGDEILNTDALSRQRLAERQAAAQSIDSQGFGQRQQGYTNALNYSNAAQNYGQMGLTAQQANQNAQLQGNQLNYNSQLVNQNLAAQLAQLGLSGQQSNLSAQLAGNQLDYQGQLANQNAGLQAQQQNYNLGESLLNADYGRQQQNYQNILGNAQLQTQAAFNPFATITSANTANQGTNQALFGNTSALSSGQLGNQYAEQAYNPFNPYSQDVYGSNFNAANARAIAGSNNAAAAAGANTAANSALANSFLKIFGQYAFGGSCWVARSVFGADNPQWLLFRHWLLSQAPCWFRKLYLKHGEKFALWLDRNSWLKPAIRKFMESRIKTLYKKGLQNGHDFGFGYGYNIKGGC